MLVTLEGVVERDARVFRQAQQHNVPITMVLSGGYATDSYKVVVASMANLIKTFNVS